MPVPSEAFRAQPRLWTSPAGDAVLVFPATAFHHSHRRTPGRISCCRCFPAQPSSIPVNPPRRSAGATRSRADLLRSWRPGRMVRLLEWLGSAIAESISICRGSRLSSVMADQLAKSPCRVWSMLSSAATAGPFGGRSPRYSVTPAVFAARAVAVCPMPGDSLRILDAWGRSCPLCRSRRAHRSVGIRLSLRPGYIARYSPGRGFEAIDQARALSTPPRLPPAAWRTRRPAYAGAIRGLAEAAIQPDVSGKPVLVAYIAGKNGGGTFDLRRRRLAQIYRPTASGLGGGNCRRLCSSPSGRLSRSRCASVPWIVSACPCRRCWLRSSPRRTRKQPCLHLGIGSRHTRYRHSHQLLHTRRLFADDRAALREHQSSPVGLSLPITTIFNAPTIEQLADIIRGRTFYSPLVPVQPRGSRPPFFLIHSYLLYGGLPAVLGEDRPFYGLRELNKSMTMEDRIASYAKEIRSVQPKGPYYIGGWCAAGPLAIETARQLINTGEEVGMVVLFDSWRPGYAAELAVLQKKMPEMALRARLRRKYLYHRSKLRPLSRPGKMKYAWNAAAAETFLHTRQFLREALGLSAAALHPLRVSAAAFHA